MPFKSEKQRRFLFANNPEMARKWARKYGSKPRKNGDAEREALRRMSS